ncbi:MAG: hypothetical protein OEZ31_04705 [Nitrospirota bacterium]|nr:hypothetical protein [Nitrospirota bacterium]MDH5768243.1 hypothetical protein [Nitrospirota bacterium]
MLTLYQGFPETVDVVICLGVAGPEVANAVVGVAVVSEVCKPLAGFVSVVFDLEISEPGAVFVALASVADVAEPQASVCIVLAFDVLVPVSVFSVEVYSSGHPRFFAFPSIGYFARFSSSSEVVHEESVHSSTGVHTNYGLCSVLSTRDLHQNKNLEHGYSKPNPDHNNVSDTNDLPMDATTNHSRKICLHLYQEQRTHSAYQAILPPEEAPQIRWVVAERFQSRYLHLRLPLLEQEQLSPMPKELSPKVIFSYFTSLN